MLCYASRTGHEITASETSRIVDFYLWPSKGERTQQTLFRRAHLTSRYIAPEQGEAYRLELRWLKRS
jgi:hypothetical protein